MSTKYFTLEQAFQEMERVLTLGNYSRATRKSYVGCLRRFFKEYPLEVNDPCKKSIEDFLLRLFENGSSAQTVRSYLQAIQFFYREIVGTKVGLRIKTPKRPSRLPVTLTRIEIERVLQTITNEKHRTMVALAYGAGLRVSELTDLRAGSIDFEECLVCLSRKEQERSDFVITGNACSRVGEADSREVYERLSF